MKKIAIILAVLLVTPLVAAADQEKVNYYTPYYAQGNVIRKAEQITVGETLRLHFFDGKILATVTEKEDSAHE